MKIIDNSKLVYQSTRLDIGYDSRTNQEWFIYVKETLVNNPRLVIVDRKKNGKKNRL